MKHLILILSIVTAGFCTAQAAAPKTPAGTWDCQVDGGGKTGVARLTFQDGPEWYDGAYVVYGEAIIAPKQGKAGHSVCAGIFGKWTFDSKGAVVGYFDLGETNQVEFRAILTAKRLTLTTRAGKAKLIYLGVPEREQPDLAGRWYAMTIAEPRRSVEAMHLAAGPGSTYSSAFSDLRGNFYDAEGVLLRAGRRVATAMFAGEAWRITVGDLNPRTWQMTTRGTTEPVGRPVVYLAVPW